MSPGKNSCKSFTRIASAKLKIFQKISTKNRKKFNNFIPKYIIHKFWM